jgi:uncharacterized protein YidB (DUF937 family)
MAPAIFNWGLTKLILTSYANDCPSSGSNHFAGRHLIICDVVYPILVNNRKAPVMSLLDSVIGGLSGKAEGQPQASPLIAIITTLLAQSGGLQGLMGKFSQAGLGQVFSQWVSTGPNPPVSGNQIQQVLGPEQIQAIAAKLGIDPAQASQMVADHLPNIVDKLTPSGTIDPNANAEEGLSSLIPSLLKQFTSSGNA